MKAIKALFISKKELKKVMEQYKEFFTFCEQYGYVIDSYSVSIVRDDDINNHSGVYNGERNELTNDYIRVEVIFKRSADFVSISSAFKQETGNELPIPPDLNADQIIGFSVIRPDNKEEFHQHYNVYCMRFGIIRNDIKIIHSQIFENRLQGHEFDMWPLNSEPFKGCSNEMLSSAYNHAIKECVAKLKYSVEYYNKNQWGNDWYVEYMKEHHPELIPILSKHDGDEHN